MQFLTQPKQCAEKKMLFKNYIVLTYSLSLKMGIANNPIPIQIKEMGLEKPLKN